MSRTFDVDNEKDMADLWDILPEDAIKINRLSKGLDTFCIDFDENVKVYSYLFKIDWHDKTEITRPKQEATEADIDKLCYFWDDSEDYSKQIGLLTEIKTENSIFKYVMSESICFAHCRRLTKQEAEKFI